VDRKSKRGGTEIQRESGSDISGSENNGGIGESASKASGGTKEYGR